MSLAYVHAPETPEVRRLSVLEQRIAAQAWRDRAEDAQLLCADLERVLRDLGRPDAVPTVLSPWRQLADRYVHLADHFGSDGTGQPTGLVVRSRPHPRASQRERALQGLVESVGMSMPVMLALVEQDLRDLHPGLRAPLATLHAALPQSVRAGRELLDALLGEVPQDAQAAVSSSLLDTMKGLHEAIDGHLPAWVGLDADLRSHGVRHTSTTQLLAREAVTYQVVPLLEARGFASRWAWRRACR